MTLYGGMSIIKANKVRPGDIIDINGWPRVVTEVSINNEHLSVYITWDTYKKEATFEGLNFPENHEIVKYSDMKEICATEIQIGDSVLLRGAEYTYRVKDVKALSGFIKLSICIPFIDENPRNINIPLNFDAILIGRKSNDINIDKAKTVVCNFTYAMEGANGKIVAQVCEGDVRVNTDQSLSEAEYRQWINAEFLRLGI